MSRCARQKPGMSSKYWRLYGVLGGIRTPVTAMRGPHCTYYQQLTRRGWHPNTLLAAIILFIGP